MNTIDKAVGGRIRTYRKALGLSQTELADSIGVRFQQVQKYESGANRVAASRLWQIAETLNVSVVSLFQDLREDPASSRESCELLDLFQRLPVSKRPMVLAFIKALSSERMLEAENADI